MYRQIKALVVDDDEFVLEIAKQTLATLGVDQVTTATNGKQVVQRYNKLPPEERHNIIFCDLEMPEMDGVQLLRYLAEINYSGSVALISGKDHGLLKAVEELAKAHRLNVVGSTQKPLKRDALSFLLARIDKSRYPEVPDKRELTITSQQITTGLKQNQFFTLFQPKVSVKTGKMTGVEVLTRWNHPEFGELPPDTFIPIAEQSNLIEQLSEQVILKTFEHVKKWRQDGLVTTLSFNISMKTLTNLKLPEFLMSNASRYKIPVNDITLEITESQLMEELATSLEVVTRLRLNGLKLSIDDFGTGYSSLEQLKRIPFTELKINRTFVHNADEDKDASAILKSSTRLAKNLNLNVVAEGVETKQDWKMVEKLGCNEVQGFFISKPLSHTRLFKWATCQQKLSASPATGTAD